MSITPPTQPDQDPARWDPHADAYAAVFEPLTTQFAAAVFDRLGPLTGLRMLDVAAGAGGAAALAASRGARVTAIDASPEMVRRIQSRTPSLTAPPLTAPPLTGPPVTAPPVAAHVMDGAALTLPPRSFDLALSSFGIVLFPDPTAAMAQLATILRPGGRVAIITWTQPHRYALATRLHQAILAVRGAPLPPRPPPAQLRYIEPATLHALLEHAGFTDIEIAPIEADLHAPSARALAASLAFAPGMAATLAATGPDRPAVLDAFATALEAEQGRGPVRLPAVAHAAIGVLALHPT